MIRQRDRSDHDYPDVGHFPDIGQQMTWQLWWKHTAMLVEELTAAVTTTSPRSAALRPSRSPPPWRPITGRRTRPGCAGSPRPTRMTTNGRGLSTRTWLVGCTAWSSGSSDRLPPDQAQWLHHVTDVGEYGLALEDMAGMLAHGQIVITNQERSDMLALADQMKAKEGNAVRHALESSPQAEWHGPGQDADTPRHPSG